MEFHDAGVRSSNIYREGGGTSLDFRFQLGLGKKFPCIV
jgi:hypothetical protein